MSRKQFLNIPHEIRLMIYEHFFANHTIRIHSKTCTCADDGRPGALFGQEQVRLECSEKQRRPENIEGQPMDSSHYRDLEVNIIQQRRQIASRNLFAHEVLHVNLFLTSKLVKEQATPILWTYTRFELHSQCIDTMPNLLQSFNMQNPDWKMGHLNCSDEASMTDRSTLIRILSATRYHVTNLSISYRHLILDEYERTICHIHWNRISADARVTIKDSRFVDIMCCQDDTIEFLERAIREAYGYTKEECCNGGMNDDSGKVGKLVWTYRDKDGGIPWYTMRWAPPIEESSEDGSDGDSERDDYDDYNEDQETACGSAALGEI